MDIKYFENNLYGSIRGIKINDEIFLFGYDVAKCLGYKNPISAINKYVWDKYIKIINSSLLITNGGIGQLFLHTNIKSKESIYEWIFKLIISNIKNNDVIKINENLRNKSKMVRVVLNNTLKSFIDYCKKYNTSMKLNFISINLTKLIQCELCGIPFGSRDNATESQLQSLIQYEKYVSNFINNQMKNNKKPEWIISELYKRLSEL